LKTSVKMEIEGRHRDLGGFEVRRVLPSVPRKMVGPFIFVDHMGPALMEPGHGLDVRPHPHINLATVTYLFEGEILHRDSLGSVQLIQPGALNWMTAGSGIVHSERSPDSARKTGARVHGLQLWVALPDGAEEVSASFEHHPAATIPEVSAGGVGVRVIAGSAYGAVSPAKVLSEMFYVEAKLARAQSIELPAEHRERAAYIVTGAVRADDRVYRAGTMVVFEEGSAAPVEAVEASHLMLLGGAPLGERHIFWNFVSSSPERIERAKTEWKERRFPLVPGDEVEFIPLPEPQP
jgi:redox-sensitive bicupin YhaK (pirin superfamily)